MLSILFSLTFFDFFKVEKSKSISLFFLEQLNNNEDAKKIMLTIHNEGKGICGVFPLDIAETKANQVVEFARINQHPLECKVQKQ